MNKARLYYCNNYSFDCEKYLCLLPKERLEKYHRLKFENDKKNCVGAYILLLHALKEQGVENFEIAFSEMGKPYIKGNLINFNLSHCKKGFVCAVDIREIGVDIQEVSLPKEITLNRACSPKEREAINGSDVEFTRLWTLKESVIKKNGESIAKYAEYEFPKIEKDFYAYNSHFVSFDENDSVISVCGEFKEIEIIKMQSFE